MSEFFQKITNFCRGKETKENDSYNEDQKQDQEIQKQTQIQIQIDDKFIQSNNSLSNSELLQSTNFNAQENQNMKNPQPQSPKIQNQQKQLFNQNQSENQNLENLFYSVQIQQKPQNFTPNSQSNIIKNQSFLEQKNQNLNYMESQINYQYPQNRIQQSTITLSPNKCNQQTQINKSLDYQSSYISNISNQQFNNKYINLQPYYQETSNKQHQNQNIIDEESNNKSFIFQKFDQHNNYQPNNNFQNNFNQNSQLKQSNQIFDSFNSSQVLTEYQSCQDDLQSKTQTQQVKCIYCKKEINIQYFLLKCQHFYCQDCLKEILKNQSKRDDCYVYRCICLKEIKLQLLFEKKDRQVQTLKEKMLINQINTLRVNLEQKYQLKQCRNKHCSFFTIIQKDLDQKYFYCPQCLDKQSDNSQNK
ncbi:unnamed protein product [Paramecium primaurelia]|uniref:RING-type domain-containing protein n=1 Tax=Paramecium primaurelia TaxID=5886 RepID=A0A8S1N2I2_PARPR|nr:unnamed protein product [Paramecium primaurelia]